MTTKSHRAKPPSRSLRLWSQAVTEHSNALDLEGGVFRLRSPRRIAESLKQSAEQSERRKASPFQSAMSMLNFYLNRAGRNLPAERKQTLNAAKDELRRLFQRPVGSPARSRRSGPAGAH